MPMQSWANNSLSTADSAALQEPSVELGTSTHPKLRRVVYVVTQFPCWSETFIVREIRTLIDEGVDVRILPLKNGSESIVQADAATLLDRVRQPTAIAKTLAGLARALWTHPLRIMKAVATVVGDTWRTPVVMVKSLWALVRGLCQAPWLEAFDPQFIHAHWSTCPATAAWALARVTGRPFGFTCHAHDVFRNHHLLPRKIADAALAITISRHNIDWLDRNISALAPRKLKVVHCGVDLSQISWQPGERAGSRILGVGRLAPEKGFHTLIDALVLLRDSGTTFQCTLIGDGPARADLQARIDGHGLGKHVQLAGAQPQEVVRAELERATVFALPCQVAANGSRDGIPVALMEAMAAGVPVVSCPVSGVPELIGDDVHGLLADEGNAASLAQALKRLLDDPSLRMRLATAARQRIELDFDARKEAIKLHGLITRAIDHAA